ncbi:DUF459 domain-containing protein [Pseudaminobacter arsenicus]|uniref:DUF459 domain-containing protein n=1 Tax=Borborobacter arsenicus TaxID=1851146 RepID=A0A432V5X8_9HYPH|nr:DUF459 domain-containing protein [Pseudaminobacter arsenicus]
MLVRIPALLLVTALLVTGFSIAAPSPASAQELIGRAWSLRDLFAPRRERRIEPQVDVPARPKARTKTRRATTRPSEPRQPVVVETPEVEKLADARTVLVVGDFLSGGLAEGLENVYAENPRVRIADRSNGSSGFVRDDFFDWPKEIGPLIEAEKPAAIVVMLGSNDRQQMRVGKTREAPRSENWIKEYERRTEAFAKVVSTHKVPFIWVGVPAFKSSKMTSDMLAFNDIYRNASEKVGAEFVDIWDGFVDENGAFVISGPDINGQPVRLRSNDGINLTKAGKRKLAFYAEKPLNKILGEAATAGAAASAPALPVLAPDAPATPVDRTVPISLSDPELDGGTELLGAPGAAPAGLPDKKHAVSKTTPEALPGRADDFTWPRRIPPVAAAPTETTTVIRR